MRADLVHLILAAGLIVSFVALSAPAAEPTPQGNEGIASKYPGDVGIERHPAVVLHETFETGAFADLKQRWTQIGNKDNKVLSFTADAPPGSAGKRSLLMTTNKERYSANLWKLFKPGFDQLHARFYVKFAPDHPYVHHLVRIGAWRDSPNWPQGEAGYRHDGAKSFQTGIEPYAGWGRGLVDPPGAWQFYTYWNGMHRANDGNYWGNGFGPQKPAQVPRGRWQCIEFMVKCNTAPDKYDGAQAYWIDGKLMGWWGPGGVRGKWFMASWKAGDGEPFRGFRWRTTNELKINTFGLQIWMHGVLRVQKRQFKLKPGVAYNPKESRVWFDDVVVATEYIGPVASKKVAAKKDKPGNPVAQAAAADDPLAKHAQAITAAEKLARSGAVDEAARAYRKIVQSVSEKDKTAGERLAVRVEGLKARKKLLRLVIKGVKSQGAKAVYIDLFGRAERAKIVKADEEQATFRIKGSRMPIAWVQISHRRFSGIAGKYAQTAADHLAIAQYMAACGDAKSARTALDKALAADPNAAEAAQARRVGEALK